ncbi:cadherin-89D isoform X2 [Schistocerca gregaria]|uniref:cadherin-89D isoform X2 n=1 Tax=Schistocerca gregaria TaxID=7010 RepID=UPI00211F25DC|nr:cadherin-89D isoform X2 [Schistocerca gregaria]
MTTWLVILLATCCTLVTGCQFSPAGEYLRFVRLPENVPVGGEVLQVEVHPRHGLSLQPIDKAEDATFFEVRELSSQLVSVALARSLEDLVDGDSPQNVLKFRLVCDYQDGDDTISSFLSVTVYVEDVNDHSPVFVNAPYHVTVDELTPVGATLFRDVRATDGDKPNTANSEVALSIAAGDERGRFSLEAGSGPRAALVLRRPLDYDAGDVEFDLTLLATDRGTPARNSTTQLVVSVVDNDDLPPKFTRDVYRTQINESYPITGARIHQELRFSPPIQAYDQDASLNAPLRYDIVSGNEQRLFLLDAQNGSLFLERELDRERHSGVLVLQLQASQADRPLRVAHARAEVVLLDLNDNLPEFEVDAYNISIVENLPNGFSVLQVAATDRDQGENAEFWFELEDPEQAFSVEADSGWLTVRDQSKLDREARPSLHMSVVAREKTPSVAGPAAAASRVAVEVTLLDANDNNPAFQPDNLYSFSVREDAAPGTVIGKVWATDVDLGRNGQVVYAVQAAGGANGSGGGGGGGGAAPAFTVDAQSGEVAVAAGARLSVGRHALFVEASDQPENPSERRFSIAVVSVDVLPVGRAGTESSTEPDFVGAPYEFWVGSTVPVGTSVGQLRTNAAVDARSAVFDLLHSFHQGVPFAVEERSGVITVVDEIGKYAPTLYDFEAVVAADPDVALVTNVTIHVVKLDGAQPQDIKREVELHVLENQPASVVGRLPPPAQEAVLGAEVRYTLANGHEEAARSLAVGADGSLLAQRPLDRERQDVFHLTALAETSRGIAAVYQVTVFVDDENDNAPAFEHARYEGAVREDAAPGAEVRLQPRAVRASDADAGSHAAFALSLRGDGSHLFRLDAATGRLYLRAPLDREQADHYNLSVVAKDTGNLSSEAKLTVSVTDVNDNAPRFVQLVVLHGEPRRSEVRNLSGSARTPLEVTVEETAPPSAPLLRLVATDRDAGDNASVSYSLAAEVLTAGPRSPWSVPHYRSVAESLNSSDAFLELDASADGGGWARTQYRTSRDDSRARWTVTRFVGDGDGDVDVDADDAWLTASRRRPEWAQPPASGPADNATGYFFAVHRTRGEIRPLRRLPAESTFVLQVVATDGPGLSDTLELRIRVADVNDHAPQFERPWYRFEVAEWNSSAEREVGRVRARDLDHGDNARLAYHLLPGGGQRGQELALPFRLGADDGVLTATRPLDREQREVYAFKVRAVDLAPPPLRRSATVDVQVVVLDVNDNAPAFESFSAIETDASGRPLPVYRASVPESAAAGQEVLRLAARDPDAGRNALLLFSLLDAAPTPPPGARRRPLLPPPPPPPLAVDPRSGVVTLSGGGAALDAERSPVISARVVAADLGSPSLSATALIQVEVQPEPEGPSARQAVFSPRYLEVSVEENCETPVVVAALNVSAPYRGLPLNLSVAPSRHAAWFAIGRDNSSLLLVASPDREATPRLEATVRATYSRRGRLVLLYPPDLGDLGHDEARVVVLVRDVNDNSPRFLGSGRPLVTAIPTSTTYGHHILTVKAEDPDEGANGEVRYSLLGGAGSGPQARFAVDAASGRVRALSTFRRDAGRVFGFDVKATDRRGADDGRSTIANVLVYVLEDDKQVIMVVATKPTMVEKNVENITTALYNATGLDVRVRKLEPHMGRDSEIVSGTDLYLYAVDPHMNAVIDMDTLQNVLTARQADVRRRLERFRVLHVSAPPPAPAHRPPTPAAAGRWLSSLEAVVLALGLIVFVGAFATAVCIGCARRKNRLRRQEELGKALTSPFTLSAAPSGPAYNGDTTDTYVDMHSRRSGDSGGGGGGPLRHQHHRHQHHRHHRHGPGCARAHQGLQASLASLHSRDSGVGGSHRPAGAGGRCICGHSTSHSSDSSGYEDSLKGAQLRRGHAPSRRQRQRHSSASAASSLGAAPAAPAPPPPGLPPASGRASPCATLGRRPSHRDAGSVR